MQHDYNGFPNQGNAYQIAQRFPHHTMVIDHRGRALLLPLFTPDQGLSLSPDRTCPPVRLPAESPVIQDINTAWDMAKYAVARRPVSLGVVNQAAQQAFATPLPVWCQHVLDMPIKFPGTDVRLPVALQSLAPVVQRVLNVEAQLNARYPDYYAYLSVHQAELLPGQRMRENPYHVDGFQGPRWETKHVANHSYLLCDQLPTVFYPVPFPLQHIDPALDDIYAEFGQVIEGGQPGAEWRPQDNELILMDAYCVHRGDLAQRPMRRTWLRISWETRVFDRLGNAHNPLFAYSWPMVARDTDPQIRPRALALAAK